MKTILAIFITSFSLFASASLKKMTCSVFENNNLVNKVDIELNEKVGRAEFGAINELTVILTDIPDTTQVSLKMIGAELGLIVEAIGSFGPAGEGISSSVLNRGFTTSINCTPNK